MKTICTAALATLALTSGSWSVSAGQDFQDAVRMGLVFHAPGSDSDRGIVPRSGR
jgi:hypothetical protein